MLSESYAIFTESCAMFTKSYTMFTLVINRLSCTNLWCSPSVWATIINNNHFIRIWRFLLLNKTRKMPLFCSNVKEVLMLAMITATHSLFTPDPSRRGRVCEALAPEGSVNRNKLHVSLTCLSSKYPIVSSIIVGTAKDRHVPVHYKRHPSKVCTN